VPFEKRYQEEREWTIRLRVTCDLFNISDGAAPLHRKGPATSQRRVTLAEERLAAKAKRPVGPSGGLGHTSATRAKMADVRRAYWAALTPEERSARNRRRGGSESPSAAAA